MEYKVEYKKKDGKNWMMYDIIGIPSNPDDVAEIKEILIESIEFAPPTQWNKGYIWRATDENDNVIEFTKE